MTQPQESLCHASDLLEKIWITRIAQLEQQGKAYGDPDFDSACLNLRAAGKNQWRLGGLPDPSEHQHPQRVVHHAASSLDARHFFVCWCCLKVHWLHLISIPQWSQMVVGTALIQLEGRSPTSSRLDESMSLPCW